MTLNESVELKPNKTGLAYDNNTVLALGLLLNFQGDCACGEFYSIHGHCFRCGDRIEFRATLADIVQHDNDCLDQAKSIRKDDFES